MNQKLKRYRIDYDGEKVFHEDHPNGEHVKFSDIEPLIEALKFYADKNSWHEFISGGNIGNGYEGDFMQCFDTPNNDDGEVARQALKSIGEV